MVSFQIDDSTVLGPSHDSEQPSETDPVPSSVPSLPADRLSVVHIVEDEDVLAGLCSHMTFAGEEVRHGDIRLST